MESVMRLAIVIALVLAVPTTASAALLDRCLRRYPDVCKVPIPSPTRSPQSGFTPATLPCEGFGMKHFDLGQARLICWDETTPRGLIEVQSYNDGDASCASFEVQLTRPDGTFSYEPYAGPAPSAVTMWKPGRYSFWVKYVGGNCPNVQFWVQ